MRYFANFGSVTPVTERRSGTFLHDGDGLDAPIALLIAAKAHSNKLGCNWVSKASGLAKISGEAVDDLRDRFDAERDAATGEQVDLLDPSLQDVLDEDDLGESELHMSLPDASEITAIQLKHGCDVQEAVIIHRREKGKGGRKKGAKNRRSADFSRYLMQFGPHPGVTLMRTTARDVGTLAAELGCSRREAMQLQIRAASELLPYMESKKPVDVNVNGFGQIGLQIEDTGHAIPDGDFTEVDMAFEGAPPLPFDDDEETAEFSHSDDDEGV